MPEILRDPKGKGITVIDDGTKSIDMAKDHGFYSEAIVYHTFNHGLMAKLADGSIIDIAPVYAVSGLPSVGKVTLHVRNYLGDSRIHHKASDGINKYRIITIANSDITDGPLYVPELNAVLFVPQHEEHAVHPGQREAVNAFVHARANDYLQRTGHSGVVISAVDWQSRITALYTEMHGRIVSIPVKHHKPSNSELHLIEAGKLISDTDPDGDAVTPYDRIRLIYVLDHKSTHRGSGHVEICTYSITKLLKSSSTSWKLGDQWFATSAAILKQRLAEEHGSIIQIGVPQAAVDDAVHLATRELSLEVEFLKADIEVYKERTKRAEAAFHNLKDLPQKVADGAYDTDHIALITAKHDLECRKVEIGQIEAEAAAVKAAAIIEKAKRDFLTATHTEHAKSKQAFWDAMGHLSKFGIGALAAYSTYKTLKPKK